MECMTPFYVCLLLLRNICSKCSEKSFHWLSMMPSPSVRFVACIFGVLHALSPHLCTLWNRVYRASDGLSRCRWVWLSVVVCEGRGCTAGTHTCSVRWERGAVCTVGVGGGGIPVGARIQTRTPLFAVRVFRTSQAFWQPRVPSDKFPIFFANLKKKRKRK